MVICQILPETIEWGEKVLIIENEIMQMVVG